MSLPTFTYYEAQLAMYLDRGVELFWRINHVGQGCFNQVSRNRVIWSGLSGCCGWLKS